MVFEGLRRDIRAVKERDPAARNTLEVLMLYSGVHAIMLHRPAHWLYNRKCYFSARYEKTHDSESLMQKSVTKCLNQGIIQ